MEVLRTRPAGDPRADPEDNGGITYPIWPGIPYEKLEVIAGENHMWGTN